MASRHANQRGAGPAPAAGSEEFEAQEFDQDPAGEGPFDERLDLHEQHDGPATTGVHSRAHARSFHQTIRFPLSSVVEAV